MNAIRLKGLLLVLPIVAPFSAPSSANGSNAYGSYRDTDDADASGGGGVRVGFTLAKMRELEFHGTCYPQSHGSARPRYVDTADGVVRLTGNVDTQETRDRPMQLAKETSGVRSVKDMISVRFGSESGDAPDPKRTVGTRIDDAGVTMRVRARLLDVAGGFRRAVGPTRAD
jgi:BON domain-containing protein